MGSEQQQQPVNAIHAALAAGRRDDAYQLAQRALAELSSEDPRITALTAIVIAWLARRDALRAEGTIDHALMVAIPNELKFLSIEVVNAVAADSQAPQGHSPTLSLATETQAALQNPAAFGFRQQWYRYVQYLVSLMLRNGMSRLAAHAARRAWESVLREPAAGTPLAPLDRASMLSSWAQAERSLAQDGQLARLAEVESALEDALCAPGFLPPALRFDLAVLLCDILYLARRPASRVRMAIDMAVSDPSRPTDALRLLARRAMLALRHRAQMPAFLERLAEVSAASVELESQEDALWIARAALGAGDLGAADAWMLAIERRAGDADASVHSNLVTLQAELLLARGDARAALTLGLSAFDTVSSALAGDARDPELRMLLERLTYLIVHGNLDVAASPASDLERAAVTRSALFALERGRAWCTAWSTHREDTRYEHGAIGLPQIDAAPDLVSDMHLVPGTLVCAFLWDSRHARLGVFLAMDATPVHFHWLGLASGGDRLVEAARTVAILGENRKRDELDAVLRALVDAATEIVLAPFEDRREQCLRSLIRQHRVTRIHVVPHGPVIGLPLHVPLQRAAPGSLRLSVSFAPTSFVLAREPAPARDKVSTAPAIVCADPAMVDQATALAQCLKTISGVTLMTPPAKLAAGLADTVAAAALLVAHGIAIGDSPGPDACSRLPRFGSTVRLGETAITTQDILRARHVPWDVAFLCLCSGARHIDPIEMQEGDERLWQLSFLDDPTAGIAGALLTVGVGQVIAFPFPVDGDSCVQFLTELFAARATASRAADGGVDWASAVAETQRGLGIRDAHGSSTALLMLMAQHWCWPVLDACRVEKSVTEQTV